jgi:hypothetical protein
MRVRRRRITLAAVAVGLGALLAGPQLNPIGAAAGPLGIVPPSNIGGGAVNMAVTFTKPLPTFNQPGCASVAFNFSGGLTGAAVNTVGSQFVGTAAPVTGSGGNTCADELDEIFGNPTFTVNPFDSTFFLLVGSSRIACPQGLVGAYLRVGLHLHIALAGSCSINQTVTGATTFFSEGEFIPAVPSEVPNTPACGLVPCGGGDGGNTPITSGTYAGSWTMVLTASH